MKPALIALLALVVAAGCGKEGEKQTAKEPLKTKEAPEKSKPKPPPIKPGTVLWEFETGGHVNSAATGDDDTVLA